MNEQVIFLKKTAKEQIKEVLKYTNYKRQINKIISYYLEFLKKGIETGLINEENINLFQIKRFDYIKGNAFAAWTNNYLMLQPKFFDELDPEDKKLIIFHECLHAINTPLLKEENESANYFYNYCTLLNDTISKDKTLKFLKQFDEAIITENDMSNPSNIAKESTQLIDEYTTQYMAELMNHNRKLGEKEPFASKILSNNYDIKSNFRIYPEYQQIFTSFLRTINGLGGIKDDNLMFNAFYQMLQKGTIWKQIIGTYQDKGTEQELFEFLLVLGILKRVKNDSIASNIFYYSNKDKFTELVYNTCLKMNKMQNNDNFISYNNKNLLIKKLNK